MNNSFFDNFNIESLTHEEKLLILDFIFDKINITNSSEDISTKFFFSTFKNMLLKLKRKIRDRSVFSCQSRLSECFGTEYQNSTDYSTNFASCQRQYSVPFMNN